jgi:tetratricopeptide (TPR) repeat protein
MSFFRYRTFNIYFATATILLLFLFLGNTANAQSGRSSDVQLRHVALNEFLQGHLLEAETLYTSLLHRAEQARDEYAVALNLIGLGDVYQNEDRREEAQEAYRRSLNILRRMPNSDYIVAILLRNMATSHIAAEHYREALNTLGQASEIAERVRQPHPQLTGQILNSFGMVYFYQGKMGKARSFFEEAMQTYAAEGTSLEAELGQSFNNLAEVYRNGRHFQKAEELYKRSIELSEKRMGPSHPDLTVMLDNLGDLYADMKRYPDAEEQFQRSLVILEKTKPMFAGRLVHTLFKLSRVYLLRGDKAAAEEMLARAAEVVRSTGVTTSEVPAVLETYSMLLESIGKRQQALDAHSRAARTRAAMTLTVRVQDLH